jgi:hypothetical protein
MKRQFNVGITVLPGYHYASNKNRREPYSEFATAKGLSNRVG